MDEAVRDPQESHRAWLAGADGRLTLAQRQEWFTHEGWETGMRSPAWRHYGALDSDGKIMIWRFTSKPSRETIHIKTGTEIGTIITVVNAHSGGNDKSNEDVRTSSFCRNLGALMGTAASGGGDKKVLNIINKARYLVGIDISTLAVKGVSAHPATSRFISLFETEYVLVPTPGDDERSIANLATIIWPNPFLGKIPPSGEIEMKRFTVSLKIGDSQRAYAGLCADKSDVVAADELKTGGVMPDDQCVKILRYANASAMAAGSQPGIVQMKDDLPPFELVVKAMASYNDVIGKTLGGST